MVKANIPCHTVATTQTEQIPDFVRQIFRPQNIADKGTVLVTEIHPMWV